MGSKATYRSPCCLLSTKNPGVLLAYPGFGIVAFTAAASKTTKNPARKSRPLCTSAKPDPFEGKDRPLDTPRPRGEKDAERQSGEHKDQNGEGEQQTTAFGCEIIKRVAAGQQNEQRENPDSSIRKSERIICVTMIKMGQNAPLQGVDR